MHSNGAVIVLRNVEELADDGLAGHTAVQEEQILMVEAAVEEAFGFVRFLVEANDDANVVLAEVGEVRFRRVQGIP